MNSFRSLIQCSALCRTTLSCSAFSFDRDGERCEMGSKLNLVQQQPASPGNLQIYVDNVEIGGPDYSFLQLILTQDL